MEDPNSMHPAMDTSALTRRLAARDTLDPSFAQDLKLNDEPSSVNASTLSIEPHLVFVLTLKLEPKVQ
jgi:hypothetical protein